MKTFNNKNKVREMQDLLDSDDELPMTYSERAEIPAYLDDRRFDDFNDIKFPWLIGQPRIYLGVPDQEDHKPVSIQTAPETQEKEIEPSILPVTTDGGTLTKKGIFEEWKSTSTPNNTVPQTTNTETTPLTVRLMTGGLIDKINKETLNEQDTAPESEQTAQQTYIKPSILPPTLPGKALIRKGILKEQDIICMKSFAALTTDDSALIWFIDFLVHKDLQSEYKFLKSCLVPSQNNYERSDKLYSQTVPNSKSFNSKYELIVI